MTLFDFPKNRHRRPSGIDLEHPSCTHHHGQFATMALMCLDFLDTKKALRDARPLVAGGGLEPPTSGL